MPSPAVESKQDMQKDFAVAPGYRSIMPLFGGGADAFGKIL